MNATKNLLKDDIHILQKSREIKNIFDSSRYMKDKKPSSISPNKLLNVSQNEKIDKVNKENEISIENNEKMKDFSDFKVTKILDEIIKHRILIKLKKNIMSLVDGRIICFSDLIKIMCSYNSFNYRINLDELEREYLEKILDYLDIIEWNKSRYMWENKEEELNKWYGSIDNIVGLEEVF
jgi:hypothetical protein